MALENVKFDVLRYTHGRKDIEILKVETRYMKKWEKGTGLKVTVRKRRQPKPLQKRINPFVKSHETKIASLKHQE